MWTDTRHWAADSHLCKGISDLVDLTSSPCVARRRAASGGTAVRARCGNSPAPTTSPGHAAGPSRTRRAKHRCGGPASAVGGPAPCIRRLRSTGSRAVSPPCRNVRAVPGRSRPLVPAGTAADPPGSARTEAVRSWRAAGPRGWVTPNTSAAWAMVNQVALPGLQRASDSRSTSACDSAAFAHFAGVLSSPRRTIRATVPSCTPSRAAASAWVSRSMSAVCPSGRTECCTASSSGGMRQFV